MVADVLTTLAVRPAGTLLTLTFDVATKSSASDPVNVVPLIVATSVLAIEPLLALASLKVPLE